MADEPLSIARMSDGRWLVVAMNNPAQIAVFAAKGTFLQPLGRAGAGPGEFRAIRFIAVTPGDTVRAFDAMLRRMTSYTPKLDMIRTIDFDVTRVSDLEFLASGSVITGQSIPTIERAGLPLHVLSAAGVITRSFGDEEPGYRTHSNDAERMWRTIAPESDSVVWVAHLVRYTLEEWKLSGQKIRELVRDVKWFRPHTNAGIDFAHPEKPPKPGLVDIRRDAAGLLWVAIHVADNNFRRALGPVKGMYGRKVIGPIDNNRYYDTIIEVIDPRTARLVASARFDDSLRFVGETAYVIAYHEDEEGFPYIHASEIRLDDSHRR